MTVHMVRLYLEPPKGEADSAVDNWVQNHNEWTEDPQSHSMSEVQVEGGSNYVCGNYRFNQGSTAKELLDDLESRLSSVQGGLWYRIGYHECVHDEDNPGDCSWTKLRENGVIPGSVPTLEVK